MNKPLLGLILGGVIGAFDGSTAFWTAPELRAEIGGILIGSAFKGLLAGLIIGFFARKIGSCPKGMLVGLAVALALTLPIAIMNATHYENPSYYWKIILPGTLTGVFVGYATVRFGKGPRTQSEVVA
jgi:MFS-type transporter involved in bile tolerance (Atg22 family)